MWNDAHQKPAIEDAKAFCQRNEITDRSARDEPLALQAAGVRISLIVPEI
jgi:hypothetical protein